MSNPLHRESTIPQETFRFFRDLARHNSTQWMEKNRLRYKQAVVIPLRQLCENLAPTVLRLNSDFDCSGRTGSNLSRINRDIRFAKDKTPYHPHMYVKFGVPFSGEGETGQLYTGISRNAVTVGFRIYSGSKRKESALAQIADARLLKDPHWLARQKKRLARRYDSYWYSNAKGRWMEKPGWPSTENWKKLQAWIVRRRFTPAAATRSKFRGDVGKIFRDLYPLLRFTSIRKNV